MTRWGALLEGLAEVFLPSVCALCGKGEPDHPLGLCPGCQDDIPALTDPYCPSCALPFTGEGPGHLCSQCSKKPPPFSRVHVRGVFDGALRRAVIDFKYRGRLQLRRTLEELLAQAVLPAVGVGGVDAVVPVPCHRRVLAGRGFDLPSLLAVSCGRRLETACHPAALKKTDADVRMVRLGLGRRRRAVSGLYVPVRSLKGRVLLVDDVVTTTATVRAAARACLKAGAEEVVVGALARTAIAPMRG